MPPSVNDLVSLGRNLYPNRHRAAALGIYMALGFVAFLILLKLIDDALDVLNVGPTAKLLVEVSVLFFILFGIFVWWAWQRTLPAFPASSPGILFALPSPSGGEKQIEKLYRQIADQVHGFRSIQVRYLQPFRHPTSIATAQAIREQTNAAVVIWGQTAYGRRGGTAQTEIPKINFTYAFRRTNPRIGGLFVESMNVALIAKRAAIRDDNDLLDLPDVARNINLVSRYIAGIVAHFQGREVEGEAILKGVVEEARARASESAFADRFASSVARVFSETFTDRGRQLSLNDVPSNEERTQLRALVEKALEVDQGNPVAHLQMAILAYWDGDLSRAHGEADEVARMEPNVPGAYLSKAFLYLVEGKPLEGYLQLKKVFEVERNLDVELLTQVLQWYDSALRTQPLRKDLELGFGLLNLRYYDSEQGAELLAGYRSWAKAERSTSKSHQSVVKVIDKALTQHAKEKASVSPD